MMAAKKALARQKRRNSRRGTAFNQSFGRAATPIRFVPHSRYGAAPIVSGEAWSEHDVLRSYWRYGHKSWEPRIVYPQTAIHADCKCQEFGSFAGWLCVDIARRCRKCRRCTCFSRSNRSIGTRRRASSSTQTVFIVRSADMSSTLGIAKSRYTRRCWQSPARHGTSGRTFRAWEMDCPRSDTSRSRRRCRKPASRNHCAPG